MSCSRHRWMIVDDYWKDAKHYVKYKCVDCPKEFLQIEGREKEKRLDGRTDK